jgi:hypothetical protein
VLEGLVALTLGLAVLGSLLATLGPGARLLALAGARGEAEDTAHLAIEALTFDLRRAGYDPTGAGVAAILRADTTGLTITADLDGDGVVDATSQETIAYVCQSTTSRLSRIVGHQSMPLADGVRQCRFGYVDASGTPVSSPPGGVAAADVARIRAVAFDLTLRASALATSSSRSAVVALRTDG